MNMNWPDQFAEQIIKSGKHKPFHVDDMKTPSGQVHVGALRGVVIHDLVYKALLKKGKKAVYTYVFNDMDPMDGFPHYLPESFKQHMGKPLYKIPSPEPGYKSLAECYAKQFEKVFNELGSKPEIIWSSELYASGKMDELVRTALDRVEKIRELYHDISGYNKPKNWYPYQVFCPKCGKVGSTIVTGWDGKEVEFECKKNLVTWAQGCGHKGKVEPKGENGKLMWKVDWAAHWKAIGVTIESSGKDHMSQGGSHDLSGAISEQVFDYPTPFAFLYEWFLAKGGAKMSSSKGVGTSAVEIGRTLPPEVLRFLLENTYFKKAIIFDPNNNESILKLFDDYDKTLKDETLPRFRDVVNYIQQASIDINEQFPKADKEELNKRIKYANIWLNTYAPEEKKVGVLTDKVEANLSADQKKYLKLIVKLLDKDWQPEELQQELYQTAKDNQINPKEAFQAIYLSLTGKTFGPKAAWLILENKQALKERIK